MKTKTGTKKDKTLIYTVVLFMVLALGLMGLNTYSNHYPVASVGDCILFDIGEKDLSNGELIAVGKVVHSDIPGGYLLMEATLVSQPFYRFSYEISFADLRSINHVVRKNCEAL